MKTITKRNLKHFKGCLIGVAIGDALGAPIEFMSMDQIRSKFGDHGLRTYSKAYGRLGAITDDTVHGRRADFIQRQTGISGNRGHGFQCLPCSFKMAIHTGNVTMQEHGII